MEPLFIDTNWTAVCLGSIVSFLVGYIWYSDYAFGPKWRSGLGLTKSGGGDMKLGLIAQAFATFFMAWAIGMTEVYNDLPLAILITLTIIAFTKASGFFAQKNRLTISIEVGYIFCMFAIMLLAHAIF